MNNRIKELISEAIKAIPDQVDFNLPKEFTEKFAELIIRDVVNTIKRTQPTTQDFEWAILNNYNLEVNDEQTN